MNHKIGKQYKYIQGNMPDDEMEIEIWDGCLLLSVDNGDDFPAPVILLKKQQVDELLAHMNKYYVSLYPSEILPNDFKTDTEVLNE